MNNSQKLLKIRELAMEGISAGTDAMYRHILELTEGIGENVLEKQDELYVTMIHKLAHEYFRIFYVDVHNGSYLEYDPYDPNPYFDTENEKKDFFMEESRDSAPVLHPDDVESFFSGLKKDRIVNELNNHGEFSLIYRVEHQGGYFFSNMKGTRIEGDDDHIIVGVKNIDADVKREKEYLMNLTQARDEANRDELTGIRNRHAYLEYIVDLERQIGSGEVTDFAVVVFDVNGLKQVNDTLGHQAGDRFIKEACKIICDIFKRSPVFRIGGDEFIVIAKGDDYINIDRLLDQIQLMNCRNEPSGGIVIAAGMARSEGETNIRTIIKRADDLMYENKKMLKMSKTEV